MLKNGGDLVGNSYLTLGTPWSVACQAPLSLGFPRQEYWSGLPFPSPGDLPDAGLEPRSPAIQVDSFYGFFTESPGKPYVTINLHNVIMGLLSLSNIGMSRVFILHVCVCVSGMLGGGHYIYSCFWF